MLYLNLYSFIYQFEIQLKNSLNIVVFSLNRNKKRININPFCFQLDPDKCRLLVDIIADVPCQFMQKNEHKSVIHTVQAYAVLLETLLTQIR